MRSHPDEALLEERLLESLESGAPLDALALRREFQGLDDVTFARVVDSAVVLRACLAERARSGAAVGGAALDWLRPGDRLGGYVIQRRLPGGGMAQVYQAIQESLYPRRVALKVHRVHGELDRELHRARREAEIASRLVHPHLAAVYDMGHDAERGLVYFSMQLVDGPDLRAAMTCGPGRAAIRRLVTRVSEVAGALAELHRAGYVHRDIKPENILLGTKGGRDGLSEAAVLVDFGLVRAERLLRGEGSTVAGTPGYAPPEAASGADVTPAWDVYSAGVVLHEALSGRPLTRDASGVPSRPRADEIAAGSLAIDRDLAAIVRRATAERPEERYADARALQADLERWLAGEFVAARRPRRMERVWRGARRHPWRVLAAAMLVPAVGLGLSIAAGEMAVRAEVRSALVAIERGELDRGWTQLEGLRPRALRAGLRERPTLLADIVRGTQRDPVTRVALAEREAGPARALELAAAFLQRDGYQVDGRPPHPDLEAYIFRQLVAAPATATRASAALTVTRLLFESPVHDAADIPATAAFREHFTAVLGRSDAGDEERELALSALGSCGTPRDLAPLVDWLLASPRPPESVRLALHAIERILRRTRPMDAVDDLEHGEWLAFERRLVALWGALRARPELAAPQPVAQHPWSSILRSWKFLHRASGVPVEYPPELVIGVDDAFLEVLAPLYGQAAGGSDEDELPAWLAHWQTNGAFALSFGTDAALLGGRDRMEQLERAALADGHDVILLRAGWDAGRNEVESGPNPLYEPDPASLLRRLLDPEREPRALVLPELPEPQAGVLARWTFQPSCARLGCPGAACRAPGCDVPPALRSTPPGLTRTGGAGDVVLGGNAVWPPAEVSDNPPHLRLSRPGDYVEAPFTLEGRGRDKPLPRVRVVVHHVAAMRPYLPGAGRAWVRVEMDGRPVADRWLVDSPGTDEVAFTLEGPFVPAVHRLRVVLLEATTTYWIQEIRVEDDRITSPPPWHGAPADAAAGG